jgi:hypothetical protein
MKDKKFIVTASHRIFATLEEALTEINKLGDDLWPGTHVYEIKNEYMPRYFLVQIIHRKGATK